MIGFIHWREKSTKLFDVGSDTRKLSKSQSSDQLEIIFKYMHLLYFLINIIRKCNSDWSTFGNFQFYLTLFKSSFSTMLFMFTLKSNYMKSCHLRVWSSAVVFWFKYSRVYLSKVTGSKVVCDCQNPSHLVAKNHSDLVDFIFIRLSTGFTVESGPVRAFEHSFLLWPHLCCTVNVPC